MSPVGPFVDFKECVLKSQDKKSPEAFCAFLEKQESGTFPTEQSAMPGDAWGIFMPAYEAAIFTGLSEADAAIKAYAELETKGWVKTFTGWERYFSAPKTKDVSGIEVFATGKWTDSSGETNEWTTKDLDRMVEAFNNKVPEKVSLKVGHTSDTFNNKIAQALGVPLQLVTGDNGQGQISLGQMSHLERRGEKLVASFTNTPETIADLIEGGQFNAVSAEINDKIGKFGPVLTGVALLGVEEPAVESLAGLDLAAVFGKELAGAHRFAFKPGEVHQEGSKKMSALDTIKSNAQKLLDSLKGLDSSNKGKENRSMKDPKETKGVALKEFAEKLGINPEELTGLAALLELTEEVTIEALHAKVAEMGTNLKTALEAVAAKAGDKDDLKSEFASLQTTVKAQATTIKAFERESRVAKYKVIADALTSIPGKPDEMAETFANTEEKAGEEVAMDIVKQYQAANKAAENAGVLSTFGSARKKEQEEADPFSVEVKEYAKEHKVSEQKALATLAQAKPTEFAAYDKRMAALRE